MNKVLLNNLVKRIQLILKRCYTHWILLLIFALSLRLFVDQWTFWNEAKKSLDKAMYSEAIMHLDRVSNNYLPFSPYNYMAIKKLEELGSHFLDQNELELALLAYETLRTSLYLTRHFYLREKSLLEVLNQKIAEIRSYQLLRSYAVQDIDIHKSQQIDILTKDYSPDEKLSLICVFTFFFFIFSCLLWIITGEFFLLAIFGLLAWILLLNFV